MAVNSEGLLAVTEYQHRCVHLLSKDGALVRSIGKGVLGGGDLCGVAFDLKGNVWVADFDNHKVLKLSQDGRLLQTIYHASDKMDCFRGPKGVSVSTEGLIYICDRNNNRVTVHDEEGKFLFSFGSKGSGPGCFAGPHDVTFGSDGLVYVTDYNNYRHGRVSVWSKEGTFKRDFRTKCIPRCIAATSDNHLVITSFDSTFIACYSHSIPSLSTFPYLVMVYTLGGKLVHEFGGLGSDLGRFNGPEGTCVDDDGLVYVADYWNNRVQVF